MGLCELLQRQSKQQRANYFCFFLPPTVDWNRLVFMHQMRFASARVMSESRCRGALAFNENETFILMNFPCLIAFAICFPPSATLPTDNISAQIELISDCLLILAINISVLAGSRSPLA
jgi:hypothetical protein